MKNRGIKGIAMLALVCVLVTAFAVTACAASYSKVYGKTADKVRVRSAASTNATIIDNIVKNACVYVTSSQTSGGMTFIKVNYRALDGNVESGWICQSDSGKTYVRILSGDQAKKEFSVSGGNLPGKKVGTFTAAQRKASAATSSSTYIKSNSSGQSVKDVQTKLKALGYYSGSISGSVGPLTEAAIKEFQRRNGLTADGVAGPQTIAKLDAAYGSKTGASSSGSTIKLGSSGAAVRDLQTDLTTLGYYWAEITGSVGPKTETAIKAFQKDYGLTADGVAGKRTLDAIATAIKRKGGTSASSGTTAGGAVLKLNSKGDSVAQLQSNLTTLGYYYASITGSFGSKTEAAVKAFQKAKGLTADGIAGKKTLDAIAAAVGGSSGSSASGLKLGSTGDSVTALQTNLTTLGFYYGDITGRFGSLTQQAVKKFQKSRGMTQDGVAGAKTIAAIENAIKNNGGVSAGSSALGTSLREGDSGEAVLELQKMLKDLGYYSGSLTGNFHGLTKQAVKKFQEANKLTVDGIAGTKTLNKLYSLSGKPSSDGSSSGTSVSTADSYGRITKDNVYLRASYSTTSASKASLKKGTLLRITKKVTSGGYTWYYVSVKSGSYVYNGYIRSDMMELIKEDEYNSAGGSAEGNYSDMETLGMIKVTGDNVSLRYSPSTSAERVGVANKGDVFYYVNSVSGWFQTRSGYWISKSYASVMSSSEVDDYIGSSTSGSTTSYKLYDVADEIKTAQERLTTLKYYSSTCSGRLGPKTEAAIKKFQKDHGLTADGVLGPKTIAKIADEYYKKVGVGVSGTIGTTVYNISWPVHYNTTFKELGFEKGCEKATLTDLKTGLSFNIYVQSTNSNHADVEPLTAADTATMCRIYDVTSASKIPWNRRAMVLTVGGYQFVCSIYGEGHGQDDKPNNNYPGQFCVHFKDSNINSGDGGSVPADQNHQAVIKNAVETLKNMTVMVATGEAKITVSEDASTIKPKK